MQGFWLTLQSSWAGLKHLVNWWLAFIATLVGLTGGVVSILPQFTASKSVHEIVQSLALAIIALTSLSALAWREFSLGRKARVASTLDWQQAASEKIRDLYIYLRDKNKSDLSERQLTEALHNAQESIQQILDCYAKIFSQMTALRCRICIKLIRNIDGDLYVFALARDQLSSAECRTHDVERLEMKIDKLNDNDTLIGLCDPRRPDQGFFLSNNLPRLRGYASTSMYYHQVITKDAKEAIESKWPLPYKSIIVVPIRQEDHGDPSLAEDGHKVVGFLGVDSPSRGAFSRRWDVTMARSLANALFPILHRYSEVSSAIETGGMKDDQKAAS